MKKTPELEELCRELAESPPDWDGIIARFKSHPEFSPDNAFVLSFYAGHFSEIHLDLCLKELAKKHAEYNVSFQPVEDGGESESYWFHYTLAGRLMAFPKKRDDMAKFEYDNLALVDGVPVAFEIKLARWYGHRAGNLVDRGGKKLHQERSGIFNSIRPEAVDSKLCSLRQYFNSDVGLVFVVPKDVYGNRSNPPEDSHYGKFIEDGGLFVPFYTGRKQFQSEALQKAGEHGLKLRTG